MLIAGDHFEHPIPETNDTQDCKRQTDSQEQPKTVSDLQWLCALRHQLPTDENRRKEYANEKNDCEKKGLA